MTEFEIGGAIDQALTHFAGLGLAAILENQGVRDLRLFWTDDAMPRLVLLATDTPRTGIAGAIRAHAMRHAESDSWVQQKTKIATTVKVVDVGLFSPRIAAPGSPEAWADLYNARRAALDADVNRSWLDAMMVQSLGEPAYWQIGDKSPRYDEGASRWEMKTRNRGEDFTRNRLSHLATTVAAREPVEIEQGLTGESVNDSKAGAESRTGTGLVPPGSVDDAVAWCALWGMSSFPVFRKRHGLSVTPAAGPPSRFHPDEMVLPVSTKRVSPAKLRRLIRSEDLAVAAFGSSATGEMQIRKALARQSLVEQRVVGLVRFPVKKAGSSSAPERQVLAGRIELLSTTGMGAR